MTGSSWRFHLKPRASLLVSLLHTLATNILSSSEANQPKPGLCAQPLCGHGETVPCLLSAEHRGPRLAPSALSSLVRHSPLPELTKVSTITFGGYQHFLDLQYTWVFLQSWSLWNSEIKPIIDFRLRERLKSQEDIIYYHITLLLKPDMTKWFSVYSVGVDDVVWNHEKPYQRERERELHSDMLILSHNFPMVTKKIIHIYKTNHVYKGWLSWETENNPRSLRGSHLSRKLP